MKRIYLGNGDVGGHLWGLHTGFERLGVASDVYYYTGKSHFGFPCNYDYSFIKELPRPRRVFERSWRILSHLAKYGLFHFNNATSFFADFWDVDLIRALGKPVFFTLNGTNVRSKRYCLEHYQYSQFGKNGLPFPCVDLAEDNARARTQAIVEKASGVFCLNPDLCNIVPSAQFLPYAKFGMGSADTFRKRTFDGKLRIAHAPTNRAVKGTEQFLRVLEAMKKSSDRFELVLIEGVDNADALALIESCDILLDQLYVGWYGGVAVEAMSRGIPVVCYIRKEDLRHLQPQMAADLPILDVAEHSLEEDLARIVDDRDALRRASIASHEYAWKYHDPMYVASMVLEEYRRCGFRG